MHEEWFRKKKTAHKFRWTWGKTNDDRIHESESFCGQILISFIHSRFQLLWKHTLLTHTHQTQHSESKRVSNHISHTSLTSAQSDRIFPVSPYFSSLQRWFFADHRWLTLMKMHDITWKVKKSSQSFGSPWIRVFDWQLLPPCHLTHIWGWENVCSSF